MFDLKLYQRRRKNLLWLMVKYYFTSGRQQITLASLIRQNPFIKSSVISMFFEVNSLFFLIQFKENSGFLLNALLKRGLSEEQPVPESMTVATAATDAFELDAMTPEPEELGTVALNSAFFSPPQSQSLAPESQHMAGSSGPTDPLEEELRSRLSQLVKRANSKDCSSSEEECTMWPVDKQTEKESERQREKKRPKDAERERQRASDRLREKASETAEQVNGQEMKRSERLMKSASVREEGRAKERRLEKAVESLEEKINEQEQTRGDKREPNRQSKRQHKRDVEKEAAQKGAGGRRTASSTTSPAVTPSSQEGVLSDNQVKRFKENSTHLICVLFLCLFH